MTYIVELCCQSKTCDLRETTVITHEEGDKSEPRVWCCPGCGTQAKRRRRLSLTDYREEQLANERRIRRLRNWR